MIVFNMTITKDDEEEEEEAKEEDEYGDVLPVDSPGLGKVVYNPGEEG